MEKIFYPITQRRLRASTHIRALTAAVKLDHRCFIQPVFVEEGLTTARAVKGLSGVQVYTRESVLKFIAKNIRSGIQKFLLFPVPAENKKDEFKFSFATDLVRSLKKEFGNEIWLAADICLCSYTSHGHCGILNEEGTKLLNSQTVDLLAKYALQLAQAGADCLAPSDMTDGRIGAIRSSLDAFGLDTVSIMSYSAKFSSQFYGPFRDACHSAPSGAALQDRKTYQLSPLNPRDALVSTLRDEQEGADILMVKPAALYTDIIASLRQQTNKPLAAYHVSGEYAAIEALASQGLVIREAAHLEVWCALARAGADIIISYAAESAKDWIEKLDY